MEINGKVHLLFEQSGTFKQEFQKLGYEAFDYDIQDNFGQTDYIIDLFAEIEKAYDGQESIFDNITEDDLVMAFFPCIYFSCMSQMLMSFTHRNYVNLSQRETTEEILKRSQNREKFFGLIVKMFSLSIEREFRIVVENPWSEQTLLKSGFVQPPTFVDNNRTTRGDYYVKPTAYWFVNCEPTYGCTIQQAKKAKKICQQPKGKKAGICSEERSMISPDYARNFICDFIIGKPQPMSQLDLFD